MVGDIFSYRILCFRMTKEFLPKLPYLELYCMGNLSQVVDLIIEGHSDIVVLKFTILALKVIFTHLMNLLEHIKPHPEKTQEYS